MAIRTVVLDFDGTLIDSNRLKYEAYFSVFADDTETRMRISKILDKIYEASRYRILDEIVAQTSGLSGAARRERVQAAAAAYNDLVMKAAKECSVIPGAEEILQFLAETEMPVYLSSNTPEEYLAEIVAARGWDHFFTGIFGYPRVKAETLREIMRREKVSPAEVLVVGDGASDCDSAEVHGAGFIAVQAGHFPLDEVIAAIENKRL
jgi:phosphoglycolate phosphatase-like HAD superfamily hydrolase